MADKELDATRAAYDAIKDLDRSQWTRCLNYLANRMAEDDRGAYIGNEFAGADVMPPVNYCTFGSMFDLSPTAEEAVLETCLSWEVIAVNGIATISQRFAVLVATDDADEVVWFDSRDDAERFIAGRHD